MTCYPLSKAAVEAAARALHDTMEGDETVSHPWEELSDAERGDYCDWACIHLRAALAVWEPSNQQSFNALHAYDELVNNRECFASDFMAHAIKAAVRTEVEK